MLICIHFQFLSFSNQKTWTYEFTDIVFTTTNPDIVEADLEVVRISRGVFGFSGFVNFKEDLEESVIVEANFYRDKYCDKQYEIQPYSVSNTTLPKAMENYYKSYLMDSLKDCATDAPIFEDFEPPLSSRCVVLDKCQISTENLPSHMDDGCYLVSVNMYGNAVLKIDVFAVVERKL